MPLNFTLPFIDEVFCKSDLSGAALAPFVDEAKSLRFGSTCTETHWKMLSLFLPKFSHFFL